MDTKWKNRIIVIIWLLLFTYGVKGLYTGASILPYETDYLKSDYFQTHQFEEQFNDFIDYLSFFELSEVTKEEMKNAISVTDQEIEEHRYRYGNLTEQVESITDQYEDQIQQALAEDNEEIAEIYITERYRKVKDITKNFQDDDHVREKIIAEKEQQIDEHFKEIEIERPRFLQYKSMFTYYLTDAVTGKVYTNLSENDVVEDVMNKEQMLFIRSYPTSDNGYFVSNDNYIFRFGYVEGLDHSVFSDEKAAYSGHIGVSKATQSSNPIVQQYYNHKQKHIALLLYLLSSVLIFALSLYFYKKANIAEKISFDQWKPYYDRIPLDIKIISFLVSVIITLTVLLSFNVNSYFDHNVFYIIKESVIALVFSALLLTLTVGQGKFLLQEMKKIQNGKLEWKKTVVYYCFQKASNLVHELFLVRSLGYQLIVLILFIGGSLAFAFVLSVLKPHLLPLFILAFLALCSFILLFIVLKVAYLNKIMNDVNQVANGNFTQDLPIKGRSVFAKLAADINTIKQGVKISQKEQAKSERLKTELITNVSHDLRTPLTSIITYTELLKGTVDLNEDQQSYVEIIDRKSKRLKVLIDDLFEASKMASGNIDLVKERIDIVQLLQQALAEYSETFEQSTIQLRVNKPDTPVYVVVDGQKMWRVFDNLIGNIVKYSLEHTRVYISLQTKKDEVIITFKNVTKYELGENIDELFERFKRGDTSRYTDGSGLGLAIAKSIVDLHNGQLDIDLDGDLFKVTVTISTR
ncbi:sensor histidine kinase [Alkalihalobacterium alkalinitrilicum]|uniref:sensor histidine kinase n=1 Tax=Alkalihalobacterium alkalinitrilicum TaxID=427920 RepID=UPI000995CC9A|nr:histidine kinase dimerization/phospho-acceptor domain-containing protein [Alkalihalobacterium alkalinitrilicum]